MELTSFVWGIFATIITLGLVGVVWIGLSLIKRTKHLEDLTKSLQIDFYERLEEMPAINSLKKSMRREEVYHLDLDGFKDRINEIEDTLSDLQQFNRILDNRLTFIQETMNGTQDQIDSIRRDMRLTPNPLPGNPGFPDPLHPFSPIPIPLWDYPAYEWPSHTFVPCKNTWTSNRTDYMNCSKRETNTSEE